MVGTVINVETTHIYTYTHRWVIVDFVGVFVYERAVVQMIHMSTTSLYFLSIVVNIVFFPSTKQV